MSLHEGCLSDSSVADNHQLEFRCDLHLLRLGHVSNLNYLKSANNSKEFELDFISLYS